MHFLMSTITQAFAEEKYRGGGLRMAEKKDVQSTEKEVVQAKTDKLKYFRFKEKGSRKKRMRKLKGRGAS